MEISLLQSLIDRNSNEIAGFECALQSERYLLRRVDPNGYEYENHKYALNYYKSRLPKLREIQKALKNEIAAEVAFDRWLRREG